MLVEYLQDFFAVSPEGEVGGLNAWRFDPKVAGAAGTLGDIGTHCLNLVEYVTGDLVTELCADMSIFAPGRKLDDDSNVLLRLRGGGKGMLTVSQCAVGEENGFRMRVFASKDVVRAVRRHIDGKPMTTEEYEFPTVYDGVRGMKFVTQAVKSSQAGSTWVAM